MTHGQHARVDQVLVNLRGALAPFADHPDTAGVLAAISHTEHHLKGGRVPDQEDELEQQYAAERAELAMKIHRAMTSSYIGPPRPMLLGDADRAVAAVILAGWVPSSDHAELRALLAESADALRDLAKKCLTVKPTLATPYPDAPDRSPWSQWIERPSQRAYNLAGKITRRLRRQA